MVIKQSQQWIYSKLTFSHQLTTPQEMCGKGPIVPYGEHCLYTGQMTAKQGDGQRILMFRTQCKEPVQFNIN